MRILVLHQYFLDKGDSGGSRFNELTKIWKDAGNDITVIAGMVHYSTGKKKEKYRGKFILKEINEDGVEVVRCHVSESYNTNFIGRLWAYFSFVFSSLIAGLFYSNKKFDVIVVTSPPLFVGITGIVISKLKRIPMVFEIRDLWPESAIDTGVLTNSLIIKMAYWFEKVVYNNAVLINCLTPAFKQTLVEKKGVDKSKILMIPNASDFSLSETLLNTFDIQQFRATLGWNEKLVIIYVGAHGVANHLIQLLETAQILKNTNVHFVLIGDGMQKPELVKWTQTNELNNVEFINSVSKDEVFKYILASDIGTSVLKKVDTFKTVYSNKTFDYMSCKKPILMAIDGVSRDLVEEAQCGVYVEPENPRDFAQKIELYLNNQDRIALEGERGYQFALQNFDRQKLGTSYLNHLMAISINKSNQ